MTKDIEYICKKQFMNMSAIEIAILNIHMSFKNGMTDKQREMLDPEYLEYYQNRGKKNYNGAFR